MHIGPWEMFPNAECDMRRKIGDRSRRRTFQLQAVHKRITIMRHRRRGRKLGRNPNHQRALLRSLASALLLTEREPFEGEENAPKVRGRIITTLEKAKEVRPLVERCITLARRALPHQDKADEMEPNAERNSDQWREWRTSDAWREWCQTIAPVVDARRRALRLLGNKQAVRILFEDIAPRFADRNGGYTRVMRLAKPRLGDAGTRAILEFVGKNDRVRHKSSKPSFEVDDAVEESNETDDVSLPPTNETTGAETDEAAVENSAEAKTDVEEK